MFLKLIFIKYKYTLFFIGFMNHSMYYINFFLYLYIIFIEILMNKLILNLNKNY